MGVKRGKGMDGLENLAPLLARVESMVVKQQRDALRCGYALSGTA